MSRRRDPNDPTNETNEHITEDSFVRLRSVSMIWFSTWLTVRPLLKEMSGSEEGRLALFTIRQLCRDSEPIEVLDENVRSFATRLLDAMGKSRSIANFQVVIRGSVRGESPEEIFIISPIAGDSIDPI